MKKKKIIITTFITLIVIIIGIIICINILNDSQRLSVDERQWLNDNKDNVISVNVINDLNIFGKDGSGLYFDLLDSLAQDYNIQINPVTFNTSENVDGTYLGYSINKDSFNSFYEDEFVLVSKKEEIINDIKDISSYKIGVISEFKDYVTKYMNNQANEYVAYDSKEEIINAFNENTELNYIIVPKIMYLDNILSGNFHIAYHISDAKVYYGISNDGSELANIINKYFASWESKNFNESFNENELNLFVSNLNITSAQMDELKANTYTYGFVNNDPYEIISGGSFGGINAAYLKKFADLIDVKLDFVKYKKVEKLEQAIKNNKVNIYFDYYNIDSDFNNISSNIIIPFTIVVDQSNNQIINSLASLNDEEIYVENNSKIYNYLKNNYNLNIKTYETKKELKKLVKDNKIIAIDLNKYESYKDNILDGYSIRYQETINSTYTFKANVNSTFDKLFSAYLEVLDNNEMRYNGLNNYFVTKKSGSFFGTIAKYILVLLTIFIIVLVVLYKKSKKIKIAKKIKKEDKMRFIDQLTSLKNRNYLNENLENWNNNTIYPQAVIVLDLNKIQDINDTLGYEKGDVQIQAAANVLIKTQLDNTDIMRTDGNEFLIYLVGYEVKQVTSYIHKLNKEFKKLPYDYGVAIGYSMITDDVKSVEDATNEAVEQVKTQKEEKKDE
jgi:diguanylate cyclase (GGDEF)-like protein